MPNVYVGGDSGAVQYNNPPPRPVKANPGPPARGIYSGSRAGSGAGTGGSGGGSGLFGPPKAPPDIFAGYLGPEIDAAKQLVQQWLALAGYPHGVDANTFTLTLLQSGDLSNPSLAYQHMFNNLPMSVREQNPWAAFGLDAMTYQNRKDQMDSMVTSLIGNMPIWDDPGKWELVGARNSLQDIYRQAFIGNWNQTEMLQALTGSTSNEIKDLLTAQPWLVTGKGYQDVSQQYASLYGSAPVDTPTLKAWFKFNQGTQQLARTASATEQAAPLAQAATLTR